MARFETQGLQKLPFQDISANGTIEAGFHIAQISDR